MVSVASLGRCPRPRHIFTKKKENLSQIVSAVQADTPMTAQGEGQDPSGGEVVPGDLPVFLLGSNMLGVRGQSPRVPGSSYRQASAVVSA